MIKIFTVLFISYAFSLSAQILPEKERATIINEVLNERFETVLPNLMYRTGIDMWVIIAREYNEDPVMRTMLPADWLHARRRTILVFYWDEEANKLDKMAISRYDVGNTIRSVWDIEKQADQWQALVSIIQEKNPQKIGINYSEYFTQADGLSKTDYESLMQVLPVEYKNKLTSAEKLAIGWIETRTALEMQLYTELVGITHDIIKTAFSSTVITPGKTTTADVEWHLRQRVTDMGLETWFHPTVDLQRSGKSSTSESDSFASAPLKEVIQPGDLLHCDFGIHYLRLNTDCQQLAYVLKSGEQEAPQYLKDALARGNQLQDILISHFETGKTGNEILMKALDQAKLEGLEPTIYTHPLGSYGHSAGTTIGMWDNQDSVLGTGDYPLHERTAYAIELNTKVTVPEWDKDIKIMLEEACYWTNDSFKFINKRQTELLLIN